ncbi:MAG: N-acetylmuramoyl-L-alanine amidase [Bacteroidaceae bacterium]|nr:N-acetylmuramoyl-L-alanine amidase [Bacteroidaceae bacterium]
MSFINYKQNHNAHSIGVCYEGGLDAQGRACDTRTPAQKEALLELLTDLHRRFPMALILGHRDLSPDLNGNGLIEPNE